MLGDGTRRGAIVAVVLTTVAVLAPYAGVISGRSIPIPDDIFASDLAGFVNGQILQVDGGR